MAAKRKTSNDLNDLVDFFVAQIAIRAAEMSEAAIRKSFATAFKADTDGATEKAFRASINKVKQQIEIAEKAVEEPERLIRHELMTISAFVNAPKAKPSKPNRK